MSNEEQELTKQEIRNSSSLLVNDDYPDDDDDDEPICFIDGTGHCSSCEE
jgi:hypothetical protein